MKPPLSVLIVEDSLDDFLLLEDLLESSEEIEARIRHADRLAGALELAGSQAFDVAVIDLSLPDSFGLETFATFHERFPTLPTVIMTGHKDHEMAFAAVRQGAQDYLFKGDPSATAIVRTLRFAVERQRLVTELRGAMDHIRQLQGMLPICCVCKSIRDDKGYWNRIDSYIAEHSEIRFSHGICPECTRKVYPNL